MWVNYRPPPPQPHSKISEAVYRFWWNKIWRHAIGDHPIIIPFIIVVENISLFHLRIVAVSLLGGGGGREDRKSICWAPGWASLWPGLAFCPHFLIVYLKTEAEFSFRNIISLFCNWRRWDKVQKNNFTFYNAPSSEIFRLRRSKSAKLRHI
jgi:hypothetical protein